MINTRLLTKLIPGITLAAALSAKMDNEQCNEIMAGKALYPSWGFTVSGEALYWKAEQSGLEFAVSSQNSDSSLADGKNLIPDPDYDWGFRVGIGMQTPHDGFDVCLYWTRFDTSFSSSGKAPSGGQLLETLSAQIANNGAVSSAKSTFKLNLDIGDLELGRAFYISKMLTCRPTIGVRGVSVREKSDVTYLGGVPTPDLISFVNNFWGVGPRGGFNSDWLLGCGFGFYGNAAASFAVGKFNNLSVKEQSGDPLTLNHHVTDNYDVGKFIFDIQLGVRWMKQFSDEQYRIELLAGWESHFFSNQWQWQVVAFSPTPNGDLNLSGFNFSAIFGF